MVKLQFLFSKTFHTVRYVWIFRSFVISIEKNSLTLLRGIESQCVSKSLYLGWRCVHFKGPFGMMKKRSLGNGNGNIIAVWVWSLAKNYQVTVMVTICRFSLLVPNSPQVFVWIPFYLYHSSSVFKTNGMEINKAFFIYNKRVLLFTHVKYTLRYEYFSLSHSDRIWSFISSWPPYIVGLCFVE